MTQEDIEKAAVDSCVIENDIFNPQLTPYYEQGFKDGANWRINTVWHDATEVPKKKGYILVWAKCFGFVTWNVNVKPAEWNKICKDNQVVEWAYIEDLIPNKED